MITNEEAMITNEDNKYSQEGRIYGKVFRSTLTMMILLNQMVLMNDHVTDQLALTPMTMTMNGRIQE